MGQTFSPALFPLLLLSSQIRIPPAYTRLYVKALELPMYYTFSVANHILSQLRRYTGHRLTSPISMSYLNTHS